MNIESYNLDTLRSLVRKLMDENHKLKSQLDQAGIPYEINDLFGERIEENSEFDPDQGGRIIKKCISDDMIQAFWRMFRSRPDVFAKRSEKGNYFPQCEIYRDKNICPKRKGEKCWYEKCEYKKWEKVTVKRIRNHLLGYDELGRDVVGVYPLLPDGTCNYIVFDFDNHEKGAEAADYANTDEGWHEEVDALRRICEDNGIKPLVERSRSGKGAHIWIFFNEPVPASLARSFGFLLLDKGAMSVNIKSFKYYDRMFPAQDMANGIGNLVALPMQGRALENGNSAFVDKNWNAYPDQWNVLFTETPKYSAEEIRQFMIKWQAEMTESVGYPYSWDPQNRPKPWKRDDKLYKAHVTGKLHIVLADGVYVDTLNLAPGIQNQIRGMAAFDNPVFYKNRNLGYSNYYNFSTVYMGKDKDGYIKIPRGLRSKLITECDRAGIEYGVEDKREKGRPIRVAFKGNLKDTQNVAAETLLSYDDGILSAATAFGKTVVGSYLIARKKVNTLIILHNSDLLEQWISELNSFLDIDEEPPVYHTKTGREKRRDSVIGVLHGGKNTLTGIVDVAMAGSLYHKGEFNEMLNSYGMVIVDECHHCGAAISAAVMQKVNARYVYGLTATPKRGDNLEKVVFMLLGAVRHSYTAKERADEQGIGHYVIPRYTRVVDICSSKDNINERYALISKSETRNDMIISDTKKCVDEGRTPVILTRLKEHARYLYEKLEGAADHIFLLYGDNTAKQNTEITEKMRNVPADQSLILIATGSKIGEGFSFSRLDTLMLAAPVSSAIILEQFTGRINRDYEGRTEAIVYDYVDPHIGKFDNMFFKRMRTYKKIGFTVLIDKAIDKQKVGAIYDSGNYMDVFERDLVEAEKQVIVSSPAISEDKVERFMYLLKPRQEAGCMVTVITTEPENIKFGSPEVCQRLINELKDNGIRVIMKDDVIEHFAVIDNHLVWHGGMNLLGKEDAWDNLIRVKSADVAEELMEMTMTESVQHVP